MRMGIGLSSGSWSSTPSPPTVEWRPEIRLTTAFGSFTLSRRAAARGAVSGPGCGSQRDSTTFPDLDWGGRDLLAQELRANPVDGFLPHFDRLLFSESGDLWVNLYHEEFAHVHRLFYSLNDWHPTAYEWEVFDREAVLVRHVTLPGAFDLRVIGEGEGFGFLTLNTGEIVVGRVDLTLTQAGVPPT
jgi:hypothetical protein